MEALKLNEHEQRVYAELFTSCDVDNSGRVPWTKASEIFRASQLPGDTIQKILEICGAKRLGHFGRSQFYIALKLIAAAQVGLPLTTDTFNSGVELPTPKFARFSVAERPKLQQQQTYPMYGQVAPSAEAESAPSQLTLERQQTLPGQLPPPPSKHSRTQSSSRPCELASTTYQQTTGGGAIGNYDHALSPPFSPTDAPSCSMQPLPGQAQQQSLPGQHHQQHPHTQQPYPGQHFVQPFPGQQHNQLHRWEFASPGEKQTNAGSQQQLPSDGHPRLPQQHRSDDDSGEAVSEEEEDVWLITEEQRQYYMNQFLTMQSDVDGLILGTTAREFFQKSKLPIAELSKIWELSDINKDGALSMDEFSIAMHLVVLRRNDIPLPDTLPASLIPRATHPTTTTTQEQQEDKDLLNFEDSMAEGGRTESDGTTPEPGSPQQQHWTTFCDSPTSLASMASSSVSSPGVRPPPMNFDFAPITVDGDSTIVHPIPVKLPMDNPQVEISSDESSLGRTKKPAEPIPYEVLYNAQGQQASPTKPRTHAEPPPPATGKFAKPIPVRAGMIAPPPGGKTPKKPVTAGATIVPGSPPPIATVTPPVVTLPMETDRHSPQKTAAVASQASSEMAPPLPPPRAKEHSRSSSLDLNLVFQSRGSQLPPPVVPPRISPAEVAGKRVINQSSLPSYQQNEDENEEEEDEKKEEKVVEEEEEEEEGGGDDTTEFANFRTFSIDPEKPRLGLQQSGGETEPMLSLEEGHDEEVTSLPPPRAKVRPHSTEGVLEDDVFSAERRRHMSAPVVPLSLTTKVYDVRDVHAAIRSQRERNWQLSRLNSEMQQELSDIMEERIALEIQLEHLNPFRF